MDHLQNTNKIKDIKKGAAGLPTGQVDEAAAAVNQAAESDVRDFLAEVLRHDEKLMTRFRIAVCHGISKTDMQQYQRQVDTVVQKYLGKDGFIAYQEAYGFIHELEGFLQEEVQLMMEHGCCQDAFALTCYLFIKAAKVDMDDSGGGKGALAEQCVDIWEALLAQADAPVQQSMYEWFTSHLDGSIPDYMEEYIEQMLMQHFCNAPYLDAMLEFTQRKVQEAQERADSWSADYQASKWALRHIRLMEENGMDSGQIRAYCKGHWKYTDIRKYDICQCIRQGNTDEAIAVLEESLTLDTDKPGVVRDFSSQLKELYQKSGRVEDYKKQLWNLVSKDNAGNIEDFRELKSLYNSGEWEQVREELFRSLPAQAHVERLYLEEGLYGRLLDYVLKSNGFYALREYEAVLAPLYPKEVLQKYAKELQKTVRIAADRARYKEWVSILRRMKKIKGGEEAVEEIANSWRAQYRNRPAMMSELDKL